MFTAQSPEIKRFAEVLNSEQLERYQRQFGTEHPELCADSCKVTIKEGKKYIKVDVNTSGKYMVVKDTGEIFGIKAYGVIHRGHRYGTLGTIEQWYWGRYRAYPKQSD